MPACLSTVMQHDVGGPASVFEIGRMLVSECIELLAAIDIPWAYILVQKSIAKMRIVA